MPTTAGVYTPISVTQAAGMYNQALQIIRGQLSAQATGHGTTGDDYVAQQLTNRYLRNVIVQPADRGRIQQIIAQAHRAHDNAIALNQPGAGRGTLAGLNVDPTIEQGGPRVRYRVVVRGPDGLGGHVEFRVNVDAGGVLEPADVIEQAIATARQLNPIRVADSAGRAFDISSGDFTGIIVGAGKSR